MFHWSRVDIQEFVYERLLLGFMTQRWTLLVSTGGSNEALSTSTQRIDQGLATAQRVKDWQQLKAALS